MLTRKNAFHFSRGRGLNVTTSLKRYVKPYIALGPYYLIKRESKRNEVSVGDILWQLHIKPYNFKASQKLHSTDGP